MGHGWVFPVQKEQEGLNPSDINTGLGFSRAMVHGANSLQGSPQCYSVVCVPGPGGP